MSDFKEASIIDLGGVSFLIYRKKRLRVHYEKGWGRIINNWKQHRKTQYKVKIKKRKKKPVSIWSPQVGDIHGRGFW